MDVLRIEVNQEDRNNAENEILRSREEVNRHFHHDAESENQKGIDENISRVGILPFRHDRK